MWCLWEGFLAMIGICFVLVMGIFLIAAGGIVGFIFLAALVALPLALFAA
jgi:hypothetical protein